MLRLSCFHDMFHKLKLDARDSVIIVREDGAIVLRSQFDFRMTGRNLTGNRSSKELQGIHPARLRILPAPTV